MEYGKTIVAGTGSTAVAGGISIGLGWYIFGAIILAVAAILAVRILFRRGE